MKWFRRPTRAPVKSETPVKSGDVTEAPAHWTLFVAMVAGEHDCQHVAGMISDAA
jgi:hypothetical protein